MFDVSHKLMFKKILSNSFCGTMNAMYPQQIHPKPFTQQIHQALLFQILKILVLREAKIL